MAAKLKALGILIIMVVVIFWLNNEIVNYNVDYYSGKDNGFFTRIISVISLSSLFYVVMSNTRKILMGVLGFLSGIVCCVLSYIVWLFFFNDYGLSFHILACLLSVTSYFLINALFPSLTRKKL
jgi:hypothetical protein